jgi:hypothetical protein
MGAQTLFRPVGHLPRRGENQGDRLARWRRLLALSLAPPPF